MTLRRTRGSGSTTLALTALARIAIRPARKGIAVVVVVALLVERIAVVVVVTLLEVEVT